MDGRDSSEPAISVQAEQLTGSTVLLRVRGELDILTSPRFRRAVMAQIDSHPRRLILHLGGVTFLDTAGLAVLTEAARLRPDLRLLVTDRTARRALKMSGLHDWFNVYDNASDALNS